MLRGTNSTQTFTKYPDLACDAESPLLKICNDFTIKLEVRCLFSTSSWGPNFCTCKLPEGLRMRKILAHMVLGCKRIQNHGWHFLHFYRFSWNYAGPKSNLHPPPHPQWNFVHGVAKPEIRNGVAKPEIFINICVTQPKLQCFLNL